MDDKFYAVLPLWKHWILWLQVVLQLSEGNIYLNTI